MLPAAQLPNRGVELAMQELERVIKKGFVHYQYTGAPSGGHFRRRRTTRSGPMVEEAGIRHQHARRRVGGPPQAQSPAKASPAPPVHHQEIIAAMRSSGLGAQTALGS